MYVYFLYIRMYVYVYVYNIYIYNKCVYIYNYAGMCGYVCKQKLFFGGNQALAVFATALT